MKIIFHVTKDNGTKVQLTHKEIKLYFFFSVCSILLSIHSDVAERVKSSLLTVGLLVGCVGPEFRDPVIGIPFVRDLAFSP